ncbi:MAG: pH-sensitive adenylate cyclase, partial [Solirubrobacterales bacterium]|nr:pH-sensitive adenylate cyclase [Solirubrobacterales bacterium]
MEVHPDPLVQNLLASGLIDPADVPLVEALAHQVRTAPGVGIGEHDILSVAQALGRAAERVAAAGADVAVRRLEATPDAEREAAIEHWLGVVLPIATDAFAVFCGHRARQIARRRLTAAAYGAATSPPVSVAFVDLRGSTAFMLEHPPAAIEALTDELYATGQAVAKQHDVAAGKFLGDGVLLVSGDARRLLDAALDAVRELGARTPLRAGAGVARGAVIRRAGDWHGPPVNLAARLAELA